MSDITQNFCCASEALRMTNDAKMKIGALVAHRLGLQEKITLAARGGSHEMCEPITTNISQTDMTSLTYFLEKHGYSVRWVLSQGG